MAPRRSTSRAFSLIELVIVVVIFGIVAAVAIPRMSSAAQSASVARVSADIDELQRAIDRYTIEHEGRSPAHDADFNVSTDIQSFHDRLTNTTTMDGYIQDNAPFGPYLQLIPKNMFSNCPDIRIDGAPDRIGCSWRFDTASGIVRSDHTLNSLWTDPDR
jgi:prepilin-type N-terminal cleavage/methylation domain-containing protein